MSEDVRVLVEVAQELARGAGSILKSQYDETMSVAYKRNPIDLVTDADKAAEAHILEGIHRHFPSHNVLAEESGTKDNASQYRWLVDPLDGTTNFAHRVPHFSVLIAVQESAIVGCAQTIVGVVYDPMRDELFVAEKDKGATLNGEAIVVSATPRLIDAVLATGFPYDRVWHRDDNHREFCRLNLLSQGVRRFGSAGLDLAYLACGRFDAYWERHLNPWDLAAGVLLVEEARGIVSNTEGNPFDLEEGSVAAANGPLHAPLLGALATAREHPANARHGLEAMLPEEMRERFVGDA